MHRPLVCAILCSLLSLLLNGPVCAIQQDPLASADGLYAEKSFALALKAYQAVFGAGGVPVARRDEVAYRICVCLGRSQRWDAALKESVAFVRAHRGTVWEPRGLYWLGRLYLGLPSDGWMVGVHATFSQDVPNGSGGDRAGPVSFSVENPRNSRDALEAAAVFYPQYRVQFHTELEEGQLCYDLASGLANMRDQLGSRGLSRALKSWPPPNRSTWQVDLSQPYTPAWPMPKKVLYLYRRAVSLAPNPHGAALARLAEAYFVAAYQLNMGYENVRWTKTGAVHLPFPYQEMKPLAMYRAILTRYPADPIVGRVKYEIARWLEANGRRAEAETAYRDLATGDPADPFVENAIATLARWRRPSVGFGFWSVHSDRAPYLPTERVKLAVDTNMVSRFHIEVCPVDVDRALADEKPSDQPFDSPVSFGRLFGTFKRAKNYLGKTAVSENLPSGVADGYGSQSRRVVLPALPPGLYLITASIPGVRAAMTILITDLKLVRVGSMLFAARAGTGAPAAHIPVRMVWSYNEQVGARSVSRTLIQRHSTDVNGLVDIQAPRKTQVDFNYNLLAVAHTSAGFALTTIESYSDYTPGASDAIQGYGVTDRPVYRPGQKVSYRFIVMHGKGGDLKPAVGRRLQVEMRDQDGNPGRHVTLVTNQFGSVAGSIALGASAKPGEYSLYGEPEPVVSSGPVVATTFRVEEYQKPEFEVTVTPDTSRVHLGQRTGVSIKARYYFGGAVAGASVTYRVFREPWRRQFRFPQPYAFLRTQDQQQQQFTDTDYRNGELAAQGTARTGNDGSVRITFDTHGDDVEGSQSPDSDFHYTVEADVRDASRRTISGAGAVKATHNDVAVFLNNLRGYVSAGETLDVEIATVNPDDAPVRCQGSATVERIHDVADQRPTTLVSRVQATDLHGRGHFRWTPRAAGRYRFTVVTRDSAGHLVRASLDLWVSGAELSRSRAVYKDVHLFVGRQYYEEGQTARVLLVAPRADCNVLLFRVSGQQVIERRLVRVPGHSLELTLPITKRDSPNVTIQVVMVRNGATFTDSAELFVPPTRQLLDVAVHASSATYRPGEFATFRVTARDSHGRPAKTELSIAISDDALRYIQSDYGGDIRASFFATQSAGVDAASGGFPAENDDMTEDTLPPSPRMPPLPQVQDMGLLDQWPLSGTQGFGGADSLTLGGGTVAGPNGMGGSPAPMAGAMSHQKGGGVSLHDSGLETLSDSGRTGAGAMGAGGIGGGIAVARADVRTQFRDTALWMPAVVTDAAGAAVVRVRWPGNLTRWRAHAVGITQLGAVGNADATVETSKKLLVLLQTPRFLVERDESVVSATVYNGSGAPVRARVSLALAGNAASLATPGQQAVTVPAKGVHRVDFRLRAKRAGLCNLTATVSSGADDDGTRASLPVVVHGIERVATQNCVISSQAELSTSLNLPAERRAGSATVVVRVNGSTMTVMLDALPYLLHYPYNCVEQTISRFVPAAVVLKAARDAGVSATDPRWKVRGVRPQVLQSLVGAGLRNVTQWQHADGGWGWWPADESNANMTAYVVNGLITLRSTGHKVADAVLKRGLNYLQRAVHDTADLNRKAEIAIVLAMDRRFMAPARASVEAVYPRREGLTPHALADLATTLVLLGDKEKAAVTLRNLVNTAHIDETGGTVHWESASGKWGWEGSDVDATAAALEAYVAVDPGARMAAMARKWLIGNRRGDAWSSTQETAAVLYALADYSHASREPAPDCTVTVALGTGFRRTIRFTTKDALFADAAFRIPDSALGSGSNILNVTRVGTGTVYVATRMAYFSQEDPIPAASGDIAVERRYYRLLPGTASGGVVAAKSIEERPNPFLTAQYELLQTGGISLGLPDTNVGPIYKRAEVTEGDPVTTGDQIEVELRVHSGNNYSYVAFEDHKPAGCEAVELRSGARAGAEVWANLELHDRTVVFFVSDLPQGTRTFTYRLWVAAPGIFHVLPTNAYGMYAPDLRALSNERRLTVRD